MIEWERWAKGTGGGSPEAASSGVRGKGGGVKLKGCHRMPKMANVRKVGERRHARGEVALPRSGRGEGYVVGAAGTRTTQAAKTLQECTTKHTRPHLEVVATDAQEGQGGELHGHTGTSHDGLACSGARLQLRQQQSQRG